MYDSEVYLNIAAVAQSMRPRLDAPNAKQRLFMRKQLPVLAGFF